MKIGIIILSVVFAVGIMYGISIMFIKFGLFRNPFKDNWGRITDLSVLQEHNIKSKQINFFNL